MRLALTSCCCIFLFGFGPQTGEARSAGFVVTVCENGAPNHSWTAEGTAPHTHLETFLGCQAGQPDPYGAMHYGIGVLDVLHGSRMPEGGDLRGADRLYAET